MESLYPYQCYEYEDLHDECWRDIDGFIDYYQVSNLGRVRSLDRYVPHPRHGTQFVRGRIMRQSIARNRNIKTGEPMIDLRVTLMLENRMHYFNVRRLVYQAFVAPIDFATDGKYIINVDANGFNNAADNVALVTKAEKSRRVFERDRIDSFLKTTDRSGWKLHGGSTRRKPIEQYNGNGQLVQRYKSITEASQLTGMAEKEIIMVAKGRWKQYRGFVWRYADHHE